MPFLTGSLARQPRRADVGVVGLGVMGCNLALNLADRGYGVATYDRDKAAIDSCLAQQPDVDSMCAVDSLESLVVHLKRPRRILLSIRAGSPVDAVVNQFTPLLEPGDVIVDCGNSHPAETRRRAGELGKLGICYVGAGISGGAEGARGGPSIMVGGSSEAWPLVRPMLQDISAEVDGAKCCAWVGENGAGHFVKTVHNGIEYGVMQLIAESYHLMRDGLGMSNASMQIVFEEWGRTELASYLLKITADIVGHAEDGEYVLDGIVDAADHKGTGLWACISALESGQPFGAVSEAVHARYVSGLRSQRFDASQVLEGPPSAYPGDGEEFLEDLKRALYASVIVAYAQGFMLLASGAREGEQTATLGDIARVWRGGCIIRAALLDDIADAFDRTPTLPSLLLSPYFREQLSRVQLSWRRVVANAVVLGIPVPAMSAALAFYDSYRSARLPANLIQAQRDYFGAHGYLRFEDDGDTLVHTVWPTSR